MPTSRRLVAIWLTAAIAAGAHVVATAEATSAPPDSTDPVATSEPVTEPVVVEPDPPTPWSEAIDAIDVEGDTDVDAALALFNIAFGPIDGWPPPPPDAGVQGDLTVAYRAVMQVWDELTPVQRDAVIAAVTPPADPSTDRPAGLRLAGAGQVSPPDPVLVDTIQEQALQLRSDIAARIGDFEGTMDVHVATRNDADRDLGAALPSWTASGAFSGSCPITIYPAATATDSDGAADIEAAARRLRNTIAHEVFHCFQFAGYGTRQAWAGAPGWVVEGGAEWVAAVVAGPDDTTPSRWSDYIGAPDRPLQKRRYDAIGFWAHLAESGGDPWSVFRDVWAVAGTPAAFERAGANSATFLDSWASGFFRDPARGQAWDTTGPHIVEGGPLPGKIDIPPDGHDTRTVAPYANGIYVLFATADVIEITATGHARLSDGVIDTTELTTSRHCRRPDGCACPNNPNDIPPLPLEDGAFLALTGGPDGSNIIVTGITLDQHCDDGEIVEPSTCPDADSVSAATGYHVSEYGVDATALDLPALDLECGYGVELDDGSFILLDVIFYTATPDQLMEVAASVAQYLASALQIPTVPPCQPITVANAQASCTLRLLPQTMASDATTIVVATDDVVLSGSASWFDLLGTHGIPAAHDLALAMVGIGIASLDQS